MALIIMYPGYSQTVSQRIDNGLEIFVMCVPGSDRLYLSPHI